MGNVLLLDSTAREEQKRKKKVSFSKESGGRKDSDARVPPQVKQQDPRTDSQVEPNSTALDRNEDDGCFPVIADLVESGFLLFLVEFAVDCRRANDQLR
jgi:hypothetical protein